MPYIGKIPAIGNYQVLDALTASATATYALTKNSVAVFPQTPANCIVSLNGVIQAPFDSYTISGSNIVFASALTGSDSIDFITVLGDVLNVGTVSDGTITTAKMFSGFANGITEADQWRLNADFSMSTIATNVLVNSNWERVDTDGFGKIGTGMTESSGIFTFPSTGIYHIQSIADILNNSGSADGNPAGLRIYTTENNSTYSLAAGGYQAAANNEYVTLTTQFIFDVTNTTTHKVGFYYRVNQSSVLRGDTGIVESGVTFIRLGDT